jgi:hypothetical protein
MFDPQQVLRHAMQQLTNEQRISIVRQMLESVAGFIDHHTIVVPELKVSVGLVEVSLSAKRLDPPKQEVASSTSTTLPPEGWVRT